MTQLLQNAAYGTAMILAAAVLRRVLRDRLVPAARLTLWAVCLFRLLTPAAPESVLSLWGLSRLFAPEKQAAPVPAPDTPVYVPYPGAPVPISRPNPEISLEAVLLAVWLAVGAVLAVYYALSWRRTRRAVACAILLDRNDPRYAPLPRFARLKEGPMEGAPLTFGVARPTVVLSPGLEGEALNCVLVHEGVHARRRDNLWHYVMTLALVIHWWNPAVWLMSRLLRRDIELSCDRAAVEKLGADRRADYANALVSLAARGSDPAFCQAFGRKAVEERIRSVMKFKKTSVIGVIFTLTLVLAVTVAFASEPKTADDTVVYHGQTYNRTDLSQETLDWLDWYLTLSEEGQLSVSMVPPELIPSQRPAVYDAQDSEAYGAELTGSSFTTMRFDDSGTLKQFTCGISALEDDLAFQVSNGSISQEQADRILDLAKSIATDGILDWTFEDDCGLTDEDLGDNTTAVCYRDQNGNLIPIGDSGIVASFILPQAFPDYDVQLDYDAKLPEFDEDGSPVNSGVIGSRLYSYSIVADGNGVAADSVCRDARGTHELCTEADCAIVDLHYHDEQHHDVIYMVDYQNPYGDSPANPADLYPRNSKGETYGPHYPNVDYSPDLILAMGTNGEEGYVRDRDVPGANVRNPDEALEYMEWVKTQPPEILIPLYDCEGNVIGQFAVSNSQSALPVGTYHVCSVSGCTLEGLHDHDGVTYCGGANHHNSTCDGSCLYCAQQSASSTHHPEGYTTPQPSTSSTHHSSDHHGNGHH